MELGFLLFFLSLFLVQKKKKSSWISGMGGEKKNEDDSKRTYPHRFCFGFFLSGGLVCSLLLDGGGWGIFALLRDVVLALCSSGEWWLGIFALLRDV